VRFGDYVSCWGTPALIANDGTGPAQIYGLLGGAKTLAGGLYQTCVLNGDGELRCWNAATEPSVVDEASTFISIATASSRTYGLKADGTVTAWNMNSATPSLLTEVVDLW
jgi:hypothetical protein